ncbi:hypothetical protein EC970259_B0081 [Escherichia coli 99.0741]|nr:hypothetical protein EC12264_A0049 [Escherichia coli 1.2264]EIH44687.1 hypothetical protein EC970259_B0081 [Escherichia coli 99.0741]
MEGSARGFLPPSINLNMHLGVPISFYSNTIVVLSQNIKHTDGVSILNMINKNIFIRD